MPDLWLSIANVTNCYIMPLKDHSKDAILPMESHGHDHKQQMMLVASDKIFSDSITQIEKAAYLKHLGSEGNEMMQGLPLVMMCTGKFE